MPKRGSPAKVPGRFPREVRKIAEVRSEYTSARLISTNLEHLNLIHLARRGHAGAAGELIRRTAELYDQIRARFAGVAMSGNEHVITYTMPVSHPEAQVGHKGVILAWGTGSSSSSPARSSARN